MLQGSAISLIRDRTGSVSISWIMRRLPLLLLIDVDGEDRRQVEPEAVDVHLLDPVAQAVENEPAHDRMIAVEGVAAAGEVVVILGLLG